MGARIFTYVRVMLLGKASVCLANGIDFGTGSNA